MAVANPAKKKYAPKLEPKFRPRGRKRMVVSLLAVAAFLGIGIFQSANEPAEDHGIAPIHVSKHVTEGPVLVSVVQLERGKLPRKVTRTGSIEAFETAHIRPRVSGYLQSITPQIGDHVEQGQVLAEIEAPEFAKDVQRQTALVQQAECRVRQAESRLRTAQAELQASFGKVGQVEADISRHLAEQAQRERNLERIEQLIRQQAIEAKLADEKRFQLASARSRVAHAQAARNVAEAEIQALQAHVEQAEADVLAAQADVRVVQAEQERAQLMVEYLTIRAPISGIITARNYDRGDFVQAASKRDESTMFTVARTDRMRAVLRVSAADAPYIRPGQVATVAISSLGGRTFTGEISRVAFQQDKRTRTMRAEIDLENPDQLLAGGMYGSVSVAVPPEHEQLLLPRSCLIGRTLDGKGNVFRLVDGVLMKTRVEIGRTNDQSFEVVAGVSANDEVVVVPAGSTHSLANGLAAIRMSDAGVEELEKDADKTVVVVQPQHPRAAE